MTNKAYIKLMLELQQSLNDETNGFGWEKGYTKTGNIINWRRCIYMECAELVDSFSWKHWKDIKKPVDWENARIEIVDIWHFIMSLLLEHNKLKSGGGIDEIAAEIENTHGFKEFCRESYVAQNMDSFEIINDIETLINKSTNKDLTIFDPMLAEYFALALKCGVNLRYLYKYYVAKNILNRFRQNHGYKEGTYKKIWNGKEDNAVLIDILTKNENLTPQELYKNMEIVYNG